MINIERRKTEYSFRGKVRAPSVADAWLLDMIGSVIVLSIVFCVAWGLATLAMS